MCTNLGIRKPWSSVRKLAQHTNEATSQIDREIYRILALCSGTTVWIFFPRLELWKRSIGCLQACGGSFGALTAAIRLMNQLSSCWGGQGSENLLSWSQTSTSSTVRRVAELNTKPRAKQLQ